VKRRDVIHRLDEVKLNVVETHAQCPMQVTTIAVMQSTVTVMKIMMGQSPLGLSLFSRCGVGISIELSRLEKEVNVHLHVPEQLVAGVRVAPRCVTVTLDDYVVDARVSDNLCTPVADVTRYVDRTTYVTRSVTTEKCVDLGVE
jgi:hypothetical protein